MIERWLEARFGDVVQASQSTELRINCPFCKARVGRSDSRFHLYISLVKPLCHCFRCSWKGNHISLIMNVDGCTYSQALLQIGDSVPDIAKFSGLYSARGLVQSEQLSSEPDGFMPLLGGKSVFVEERAVRRYLLKKRKVPLSLVEEYFGWVPGSNRVWMLVDDNWWQGRLLTVGEPKYISPPWPRGDSLWNADALNGNVVDVCEGVFSAIAVGLTAVALCAKTINDEQIKRIVQANPKSLCLRLDAGADGDAHVMAERFVRLGYRGALKIRYMQSGDPADGVPGPMVKWEWHTNVRHELSL